MNGTIGCIGLLAIAAFIVLLALWSRSKRKGVAQFYAKYSMVAADDAPQNVRDAMGVDVPLCLKGKIKPAAGGEVQFYWWEWSSSSMHYTGGGSHGSISCFLAVSFPPNTVSEAFERKTFEEKDAATGILTKVKRGIALDTETPIRIEKLPDGTFIIFWAVLQRPEIMEHKIAWLRENLSVPAPKNNAMNTNFVQADVELSLMVMDQNGNYAPTAPMTYTYFFAVPDAFVAGLADSSAGLMQKIYDEHYQLFRIAEPSDPNYIAVVGVEPRLLTPAETAAKPWLEAKIPAWENCICVVVNGEGFEKVEPENFGS